MAKEVVMTREGYQKLEQDLNELRTVKRVFQRHRFLWYACKDPRRGG